MKEVDCGILNSFRLLLAISSLSLGLLSVVDLGQDSLVVIVEFGELGGVNLWPLDDLNLSNSDVLDRVDSVDFLGNLLLDNFGGEEVEDLGGGGFSDLLGNDLVHAASDLLLLRAEGIVGLLLLVCRFSGEDDGENSDNISVLGSAILNSFNEGFALLDEGAKLVTGHIDTVEAAESISSSGLIDDQTDFSPGKVVLVGGKISLARLYNTSTNAIFDFL